jgi:hypothetical protein
VGAEPVEALDDGRDAAAESLGDLDDDSCGLDPSIDDGELQPVVAVGVEVEGARAEVDEKQRIVR